ncbi:MAG TPA: hypothetical protein VFU15_11745 [Bacteroidia bacterium]|nr:hypothetical protein [Bacteroidia bacterium]
MKRKLVHIFRRDDDKLVHVVTLYVTLIFWLVTVAVIFLVQNAG